MQHDLSNAHLILDSFSGIDIDAFFKLVIDSQTSENLVKLTKASH